MENKKLEHALNVVEEFIKKLEDSGAFSMTDETKEELLKGALDQIETKINHTKSELEDYQKRYETVKEAYDNLPKVNKEPLNYKVGKYIAVAIAKTPKNSSAYFINLESKVFKHPEEFVVISKEEFKRLLDVVKESKKFKGLHKNPGEGLETVHLSTESEFKRQIVDIIDGKFVIPILNYVLEIGDESAHNVTLNINQDKK